MAEEGTHVLVADVDEESAREVASELERDSGFHEADVIHEEEVEALIRRVTDQWGGLDAMVNDAGVGVATTPEMSEEDYERVMDVCVRVTFLGMKYATPLARRDSDGGSVTNMSSIAALVGLNDRAVHSTAKGAILSLTRAAAIDNIEEGVRVNCIAPGTVDTPWVVRITAGCEDPEDAREKIKARQPYGRLVSPEEIAAMAAYLASDEASSVVGDVMVLDGGVTAR